MSAGAWILFRSSPSRWITPVLAAVCTLLVIDRVGSAMTSMEASAEATVAVLVWMPTTVLSAYLGTRAAALDRAPDVFAADARGRRRRVGTAVLAALAWAALGWVGFWAGCALVAARHDTPVHHVMCVNGLALTIIGSAVGTAVAAIRAPAWVAASATVASYAGLAVWLYVPDTAISVLNSVYSPLLFPDELPSPTYLLAQFAWAIAVLFCTAAWLMSRRGGLLIAAALAVAATLTTAASAGLDRTVPRAGNMALVCEPHRGVEICLWSDHEETRALLAREVDLARSLLPGSSLPTVMAEGSWEDLSSEQLLPAGATSTSTTQIETTRHPRSRAATAELVAHTIEPPDSCPHLVSAPENGGVPVGHLVRTVVLAGRLDGTLDDRAVADWLARTRADVRRCRPPGLP